MCNILQKLKKTLPFAETQESHRKRVAVWESWDTNQFGFLSLSEIKAQLIDLLDLSDNSHMNLILTLAYRRVKELTENRSNFNGEFLQRRYFKLFIESFTKLFQKMLLFEYFDCDKDQRISCRELALVEEVFSKWNIGCRNLNKIEQMSTRNQLTLEPFIEWINNVAEEKINLII